MPCPGSSWTIPSSQWQYYSYKSAWHLPFLVGLLSVVLRGNCAHLGVGHRTGTSSSSVTEKERWRAELPPCKSNPALIPDLTIGKRGNSKRVWKHGSNVHDKKKGGGRLGQWPKSGPSLTEEARCVPCETDLRSLELLPRRLLSFGSTDREQTPKARQSSQALCMVQLHRCKCDFNLFLQSICLRQSRILRE